MDLAEINAAYTAAAWTDFAVAMAGAAAALTGLLFVAVSINLDSILKLDGLPARAAQTLALLVNVLLVSTFVLVPGQRSALLGLEMLVVSGALWAAVTRSLLPLPQLQSEWRRNYLFTLLGVQVAMLAFVVCGVSLLVGSGGGLYWIVLGVAGSITLAVINAWVLMVEILR